MTLPPSHKATLEQGREFAEALGFALITWAYVEHELCLLASLCVRRGPERQAIAIGFLSAETFRTKLNFASHLVEFRYGGSKYFSSWKAMRERLRRISGKRNDLVHYLAVEYLQEKQGRRFALAPWLDPLLTPITIAKTKANSKPLDGALFQADIEQITRSFRTVLRDLAALRVLLGAVPRRAPVSRAPKDRQSKK
jgi:hypothetical protein